MYEDELRPIEQKTQIAYIQAEQESFYFFT